MHHKRNVLVAAVSFLAFAGCVTAAPKTSSLKTASGGTPEPGTLYVCAWMASENGSNEQTFMCIEYEKFLEHLQPTGTAYEAKVGHGTP